MTLDAAAPQPMPSSRTHRRAMAIDPAALAELERSYRGKLVRPGDPDYDEHRRVWNGSIDRRPALIARCVCGEDVVAAVRIGRRTGLPVAVRSGGHSFPGLSVCDDGIVIDLRSMTGLHVDRDAGIARVQAGVLLGELDAATQPHGLAVPIGAISHTGLAGLTLGGGIGWLMRKHGLTIDQLLSASLVTADGQVVTASEVENPDLFWGVRGGGGNFGIVTRFAFRMVPVGPAVLGGVIFWALEDALDVARHYRDWCADLPGEMTTALIFRRAPATELVPPSCKVVSSLELQVVGRASWIVASESSRRCASSGNRSSTAVRGDRLSTCNRCLIRVSAWALRLSAFLRRGRSQRRCRPRRPRPCAANRVAPLVGHHLAARRRRGACRPGRDGLR